MSGAVAAAAVAGAVAIGTTAYTARQNRKNQERAEAASKNAAAKSQSQSNDPVQNYSRRRRMTQGFDTAAMVNPLLSPPAAGGNVLGA